ncbi:MAG: septum site-determining protein MinC [Lachnospiraceae bacterium]|nr:septum site-determining protein MinC [Lachnospiraceae bacterium]
MKNTVVIKSYQNGVNLLLDADCSFEELLQEIAFKFSQSRAFFGTAKMALSMSGRDLDSSEELQILDTISQNSDVNIVCIVGKDAETDRNFIKALDELDQRLSDGNNEGQFYRGTLKNKEILETEKSIVILGDVYPGSMIISNRDIIILGGLYGEAYAGGNGSKNHYIVALEMAPEKLQIGDFKYKNTTKTKWGLKPKVQPKIAFVKDGRIVTEPLTKELLEAF